MDKLRIGIDLGGTKIEAIALPSGRSFSAPVRIATPEWNYHHTLDAIQGLVTTMEQEYGEEALVGIGIPGAPSLKNGLIKNANSTYLIGRPLGVDLEAKLNRPVRIANDANCFALSEARDGAGVGCDAVFGVILGTGVGGGIILNGRLHAGRNHIAGEWGHNPLPWPDCAEERESACYCGRTGCIESHLSGPALERQYQAQTGKAAMATDIAALADDGDSGALAVMTRYEDRLARALASVINILDPDAVILGGGLSRMARLYQSIPPRLSDYVFSDSIDTRLLAPRYGDSSGVRGAALLWNGEE